MMRFVAYLIRWQIFLKIVKFILTNMEEKNNGTD